MDKKQLAWVITSRQMQRSKEAKIINPEERAKAEHFHYIKNNIKRFYYVERCRAYLDSISGAPERCINYTLFYNGQYYVNLDWAAKINLPNRCYWHDGNNLWLALTTFGITWVLDYLLHRNKVLVIRKSTLVDRKGEPNIEKII